MPAQELQDRRERDGLHVGKAGGLELDDRVAVQPVEPFVEQTGLSDPGLADKQDDRGLARGGVAELASEAVHLALAATERGQPALPRHLEPGPAPKRRLHLVGADRPGLALERELAQILEDEKPLRQLFGRRTGHDLTRTGDAQ